MAASGRQIGLGERGVGACQGVRNGQPDVPSQVTRLVEPARALPRRMQRYGHHRIRAG